VTEGGTSSWCQMWGQLPLIRRATRSGPLLQFHLELSDRPSVLGIPHQHVGQEGRVGRDAPGLPLLPLSRLDADTRCEEGHARAYRSTSPASPIPGSTGGVFPARPLPRDE
jgi:hypothetical protein